VACSRRAEVVSGHCADLATSMGMEFRCVQAPDLPIYFARSFSPRFGDVEKPDSVESSLLNGYNI